MSDSLGNVSVSFTVPNENATWQFYALAYTSDLFTGRYEAQTISSKPLMVSPNLPRFVRQGDEVTVSTAIQNRTDLSRRQRQMCIRDSLYRESLRLSKIRLHRRCRRKPHGRLQLLRSRRNRSIRLPHKSIHPATQRWRTTDTARIARKSAGNRQ